MSTSAPCVKLDSTRQNLKTTTMTFSLRRTTKRDSTANDDPPAAKIAKLNKTLKNTWRAEWRDRNEIKQSKFSSNWITHQTAVVVFPFFIELPSSSLAVDIVMGSTITCYGIPTTPMWTNWKTSYHPFRGMEQIPGMTDGRTTWLGAMT